MMDIDTPVVNEKNIEREANLEAPVDEGVSDLAKDQDSNGEGKEMDEENENDENGDKDADVNDDDKESIKTESTEAEPDDPNEILMKAVTHKDEGNSHFKSGDLVKASRSYRKGTSLLKNLNKENTGDEQVKVLLVNLQTNLSMVCFKQNKHQQSRDVATKALDIDSKNVKALYRRAAACRKLKDVDTAKKDLKLALQCDPTNRAVKKELIFVKKEADDLTKKKKAALSKAFSSKGGSFLYDDKEEAEKKKAQEKKLKEEAEKKAKEKRKVEWEDECVSLLSRGEEAITFEDYEKDIKKKKEEAEKARKKSKKEEEDKRAAERRALKKEAKKEESDDDDDELTEKELQMLRGYKKTSDGRTTSYFSREQTEEEKKLLGNIAPQRLEETPAPPQRLESTASSKSSSTWNQAGTWEEKDTSEWCNSSLTIFLKSARVEIGSLVGSIKEVKDLSGDASVAFVSGKKRYIFDYNASVKYSFHDGEDNRVASGTLQLPDISSTAMSDELEVNVLAWKKVPSEENLEAAVACRDALVCEIRHQVFAFVNAFNTEY
mmetsp:Transcript_24172/g.35871  ORF Transcript_24172/g.35871 Transcript_24172/m.35871 type:complete len:549 (+) Transcript_24172:50-1696(+)